MFMKLSPGFYFLVVIGVAFLPTWLLVNKFQLNVLMQFCYRTNPLLSDPENQTAIKKAFGS